MPDLKALYEQALADIRAIPTSAPPAAKTKALTAASCCTGDRRGYQRHQRNRVPACEAALTANREYTRRYTKVGAR